MAVALGTPYATYTLIGINALMMVLAYPRSSRWFDLGLQAVAIDQLGENYRIITSAFLHGSALHIAFNMLLLFQLRSILERSLGLGRFVGLYFISLIGGSLGALLASSALTLTIGASGAVFGLMGALAVFVRTRGGDIWSSGIGGLLVINIMITFIAPGISVGGHLGGLAAGAMSGWMLDTGTRTQPPRLSNTLAAVYSIGMSAALFVAAVMAAGWAVGRL